VTPQADEGMPNACILTTDDYAARLAWIASLNSTALRDEHREDLRLDLLYAPESRDRVLELIEREKACCAFLSFTLHDEPGQLRLVIQAPETARDGADAAFAPFRSKAAASPACGCRAGASA